MKFLTTEAENNNYFLEKARNNKQELYSEIHHPQSIIDVFKDSNSFQGWNKKNIANISDLRYNSFSKGDSLILDFGENLVGYVKILLQTAGAPQDAPVHLKLTFGEVLGEIVDQKEYDNYKGWLSSSWLQQESIRIDNANSWLKLQRRYTFRYLKIDILDTSTKFKVKFDDIQMNSITAANPLKTPTVTVQDPLLAKIDKVALHTLKNNMLDTYVDAPKRDRRLWLGDYWETVKADYYTYQNFKLSRRCLYLFAGTRDHKGRVPADLFIVNDLPIPDNIYWMTWLLMFGDALYDYFEASNDTDTLKDLFPVALKQIKNSIDLTDADGILPDFQFAQTNVDENGGSFIDWNEKTNLQAPTQAVLIYTMERLKELSKFLNDHEALDYLKTNLNLIRSSVMKKFWDKKLQVFTSGKEKQVSTITQIWMVKAGVLGIEDSKKLLLKVVNDKFDVVHVMPFNQNIFIETLLENGLTKEGIKQLKDYYGYMVKKGADTFWEILDFNNEKASPYGSYIINSYCHGWGTYPSYLIRKFKL